MNRFSNYTPSAYSPMSFEEIAIVPMMKRKQHDEILAKQELVRAGLAKVDPYKKHFDEAIKLKQEMESQLDNTATELSKNGINNDMIGKTIALNRQYQDLISPTGKLGQINAEKINIAKINDEYDKLAAANKWSPAESEYWKNKALDEYNSKPIYDDTGKLLNYTSPTAAPTRIDYSKKMDDYASRAGMNTSEFAEAAQELARDEASGQSAVKGSSYSKKWGNNYKQVKAAYDTMKREMTDPTSDVYKSMEYERRSAPNLLETINRQADIYKKKIYSEESGSTINPYGSADKTNTGGISLYLFIINNLFCLYVNNHHKL